MSAHTPGPWAVGDDGSIFAEVGVHVGSISSVDDFPCLGDEELEEHRAECEANSRLIAAAPKMLAALKTALAESGCDGDLCMHNWHDIVRAAIRDAEEGA